MNPDTENADDVTWILREADGRGTEDCHDDAYARSAGAHKHPIEMHLGVDHGTPSLYRGDLILVCGPALGRNPN